MPRLPLQVRVSERQRKAMIRHTGCGSADLGSRAGSASQSPGAIAKLLDFLDTSFLMCKTGAVMPFVYGRE